MNTLELDERLILRMAQGDNDAFHDLYQQTSAAVYGFALSILRNRHDAENIMHDTYIRVHHSSGSYKPKGKPMAWILTIVRNLCYTKLKSGDVCEDLSQYENIAHPDESERTVDHMILQKALDILEFEDRQIVVLHALTGMKHREIAELLDMPVGTVLSKYKRSLEKMRKELEGKGENHER